MPQPKSRLRNIVVKEVSLVEEGDNPGAKVALWKRRPAPVSLRKRFVDAMAALRTTTGRAPSAAVAKQLYDDIRERQRASQVYDALMTRMSALSDSLHSIIWNYGGEDDEDRDVEALIRETVEQFADSIEEETADLIAGRITKLAKGYAEQPSIEAFEAALCAEVADLEQEFAKRSPAGPARTRKETTVKKNLEQILAGLPAEEQAILKARLEQPDPEVAKLKAELAKLKPSGDPAPADPLATLPAELRKKLDDERTALEKTIAEERTKREKLEADVVKMRTDGERAAFAKSLDFQALATKTEELVDLLFDVPVEKRTKLVAVLKAANEAASRAFGVIGTDLSAGAGTVAAEVEALVKDMRKAKPELTVEQARTAIYRENPELYALLQAEQGGGQRAH